MEIVIFIITGLILLFGVILFTLLTGLFQKTDPVSKKVENKKTRKQKTKPSLEIKHEECIKIDDYITNNQLKEAEVASILSVLFKKVSTKLWGKIIPNEINAELNFRNAKICELKTVINDLQDRLTTTLEQLENNSESNKKLETALKERICSLYKNIELLWVQQNESESAYQEHERDLKNAVNESTKTCCNLLEMRETEEKEVKRLEGQLKEIKVNCGVDAVVKVDEEIGLLQKELCLSNRQVVIVNNKIACLGSLVEEKEAGKLSQSDNQFVEMKERLVIKEARVVQLTNFVAELKNQLNKTKGQLREKETELTKATVMLEGLKSDSEMVRLTANYTDMKNKLSAAYNEIDKLESSNPPLLC